MPPQETGYARRLRNHGMDLRDMLLAGGVGQYNAVLGIPYMNMLPSTTEPYAQGVQIIVKGLQHLLNQRGAQLVEDGGLGDKTIRAIRIYSGPLWTQKSWAQLYGDVLTGKKWPGWQRAGRDIGPPGSLDGDRWDYSVAPLEGDALMDLLTNPIVLAAGGFFVWWKFFRKPRRGGQSQKLLPAGELEDL